MDKKTISAYVSRELYELARQDRVNCSALFDRALREELGKRHPEMLDREIQDIDEQIGDSEKRAAELRQLKEKRVMQKLEAGERKKTADEKARLALEAERRELAVILELRKKDTSGYPLEVVLKNRFEHLNRSGCNITFDEYRQIADEVGQ